MARKGKFKILSYIVEEYLIFYTSLNRNKKILAFSIVETKDFYPLISILNDYLNKRFLNYYSIQIDISQKDNKFFVLNFEDYRKERIIKFFNLIYQKIIKSKSTYQFLRNKRLVKKYLDVLIRNFNTDISLLKKNDSIIIKDDIFNFYKINLNNLENKNSFIHNFLKLTRSFNRNGHLIFNLNKDNSSNLIITAYFIDKRKNNKSNAKIENEINEFFNQYLLEKQKINLREIYSVLWRFKISNKLFFFSNFSELFRNEKRYDFQDISKFNLQFEYNLLKKHIKFKRLNKNLLFIEQKALFFSTIHLDFELILKLLKRYCSKYLIYILILNERDYNILLRYLDKINLLENVKVMSLNDFSSLKIDVFKKNFILKNAQIDGDILSRVVRM